VECRAELTVENMGIGAEDTGADDPYSDTWTARIFDS
jgi:hypothetical protein